jgi:GT2 family glycosyltransferase
LENNNKILSIVIVNWNALKETTECMDSVYTDNFLKENPGSTEITLIDNNSTDNSVSELQNKFPQINLILNKENLGYAHACNQGMKTAKGKYVLLLGNDTVLKPNALSECVNFLEQNADCGAVGCRLVYPDGRLQGNCKRFPKFKNAFYTYLSLNRMNRDYDMTWFDYNKTIEVDQIATTFLMIRKNIVKNTGYFDERYRILYNDVDLCRKIWDNGFKIFFIHTAEVIHAGSHSTKKASYKIRRIMYGDIFRYFRNNFGFKANLLLPVLSIRLLIISAIKYH